MSWTFYNASGQRLSTAATSINVLDIDGATDIGAAIVDADLFIIDDGAGGTNRKTEASRLKTYAGTTQAVQSDIEAETNQDTYVPPDLMKHHPGVAKVWCSITRDAGTPSLDSPSYNVASLADHGSSQTQINFTDDFSSVVYCTGGCGTQTDIAQIIGTEYRAVGQFSIETRNSSGTLVDTDDKTAWAWGDQ